MQESGLMEGPRRAKSWRAAGRRMGAGAMQVVGESWLAEGPRGAGAQAWAWARGLGEVEVAEESRLVEGPRRVKEARLAKGGRVDEEQAGR